MKGAYLDHASATPVRKEVLDAMLPYFSEKYGNPSNVYDMGSKIRQVVEEQRQAIRQVVEEEKKAVWARVEELRTSISKLGHR